MMTQRQTRDCPLPAWARGICRWTLGSDLRPGDTVFFNAFAHPRQLNQQLQPGRWRATINGGAHGYGKVIPNVLAEVDPDRWYVVAPLEGTVAQ